MDKEQLRKYAELVVKVGVNLQPGQHLVVGYGERQVFPEHIEFVRMLTEVAYDVGAKFVQIDWGDEHWRRETVKRGSLETLEARTRWQAQWVEQLAAEGAAFVAIPSSDPALYEGIDPERVTTATRASKTIFRPFNDRRTNDEYSWTLASVPTQAWADKVHPELPEDERVEALWRDILKCTRADGPDLISTWQTHLQNLERRAAWLNQQKLQKLHYQGPGTDLTIEMAKGHYWKSAGANTPQGVRFVANMPTEEVFSVPDKHGVNGTVTSTMPLNHNGTLIEGIQLRFENGRIVAYSARAGEDALRGIVETDEGSHYLGEAALVPVDSPISQHGVLFYNTLFDENASCHLAIGNAYPLIEGGHDLPRSKWAAHGLNESLNHVDFMIGSDQLDIDGETADGKRVPVMRAGKWVSGV
ncbi:aminopeptidase [Alicyclobacillus cycloheptanicus]|uniref:Aminopeptidase n=1 Tax=Alicyclobacillus cycloheptanicus TaxID=1457 RepID=A0ABT9XHF0_9BACL|nr:aminopeptidase [Alicyclobacillus cycloheptanicus]MDQ0189732.1 aminopeptidase [Alicyclobacillus cycloheptanicus]